MPKAKDIIVVLPIVVAYMLLFQVFELHGLLAAVLSLLTIPFSTIIQMMLYPHKTVVAPVPRNGVVIPIQSDQDTAEEIISEPDTRTSNFILQFWLATSLIVFAVIVFIVATSQAPDSTLRDSETDVATTSVRNPKYISNPTMYLLDSKNEVVDAPFPLQQQLFVEGIRRLTNNQMLVLQVSYPTRVADRNIFKLVDIYVPGMTMVTCTENDLTEQYLKTQIVGKYIFADVSSVEGITAFYTPRVYAQLSVPEANLDRYTDLTKDLVSKGFANISPLSPMYGALYEDASPTGNGPRKQYYTSGSNTTDITTFNLNAAQWFTDLESQKQVAKLEKRGSWACLD